MKNDSLTIEINKRMNSKLIKFTLIRTAAFILYFATTAMLFLEVQKISVQLNYDPIAYSTLAFMLYSMLFVLSFRFTVSKVDSKLLKDAVTEEELDQLIEIHNIDPEIVSKFKDNHLLNYSANECIKINSKDIDFDTFSDEIGIVQKRLDESYIKDTEYEPLDVIQLIKTSVTINHIKTQKV